MLTSAPWIYSLFSREIAADLFCRFYAMCIVQQSRIPTCPFESTHWGGGGGVTLPRAKTEANWLYSETSVTTICIICLFEVHIYRCWTGFTYLFREINTWRLHVFIWVPSKYMNFLPTIQRRSIGDLKLSIGVNVNVLLSLNSILSNCSKVNDKLVSQGS